MNLIPKYIYIKYQNKLRNYSFRIVKEIEKRIKFYKPIFINI